VGIFRRDTTSSSIDDPADAGTGIPTEDVDVVPAPADPKERQAFIQSLVAEVSEEHTGGDLAAAEAALSSKIQASGLPEQPQKWVTDTASEIVEGRHVVVDRHLRIGNAPGEARVPDEARDSDA
jgi:hypothetical protein